MPEPKIQFERPVISIDRASRCYALFDDFNLVQNFLSYSSEEAAIAQGKAFFAEHTATVPEIVYPRIDKITMTTGRTRRRR